MTTVRPTPHGAPDLDGQVAIVTGGARGIGSGAARALASAGASVAVCDINALGARTVVDSIVAGGGGAIACGQRLGDEGAAEEIAEVVMAEFGRIDILVNNAGISAAGPMWSLSTADFRRVVDVDLTAVFELSREVVARSMLSRKSGKIINVTSRVALRGRPLEAAYSAAKMGVVGLTISHALELMPYGINVNAISPAAWTPMAEEQAPDVQEAMRRSREKNVLGRVGEVEDVLPTLMFLASSASDYVTGQIIHVNGEPAHIL